MTIITAELQGQIHGMTANAFMSVSLEPPLVVVSVDNRAHMNQLLRIGCNFGISVLSEDQEALSDHFAGRPVDDLTIRFVKPTGIPLMEGALAHLVVRIVEKYLVGDHTLYVGAVGYIAWSDSHPLLFYGGKYHHLMRGQHNPDIWSEDEMLLFSIASFDQSTTKTPGDTD